MAPQYADLDTTPLRHPYSWVQKEDLLNWSDRVTGHAHGLHVPKTLSYEASPDSRPQYQRALSHTNKSSLDISAILGIECDTSVDKDDFWRMGYRHPVQLTNWAFAMAPQNPITVRYLANLAENIHQNASVLHKLDPLDLTGPPALTQAVKDHCEHELPGFDLNSVSGVGDSAGGRSKVAVGDILVLPITGFSYEGPSCCIFSCLRLKQSWPRVIPQHGQSSLYSCSRKTTPRCRRHLAAGKRQSCRGQTLPDVPGSMQRLEQSGMKQS